MAPLRSPPARLCLRWNHTGINWPQAIVVLALSLSEYRLLRQTDFSRAGTNCHSSPRLQVGACSVLVAR